MPIEVRPAEQRFRTKSEGRTTFHSFSFGAHYDPANIGFADLVALNEERLPNGTGYPHHPHRGVEIVSLVLEGELRHQSSVGSAVVGSGELQHLSAGTGVEHSEFSHSGPARFLQTWVRSTQPDAEPGYQHIHVDVGPELTLVAGPQGAPLVLPAEMELWLTRSSASQHITLPDSTKLLVIVTAGQIRIGERYLQAGGEARIVDHPKRSVEVVDPGTHLVVWASRERTLGATQEAHQSPPETNGHTIE